MKHFMYILLCVSLLPACKESVRQRKHKTAYLPFDARSLNIPDSCSTKKIRGQVLYVPAYSNIPYFKQGKEYDLSVFVAIHNTDFQHTMKITKVLFFDNDGNLVNSFLNKDSVLQPLGTADFFIPTSDQSGTGSNFIIEWTSDTAINEPLIESVMTGLTSVQGVSFLSTGKVLREVK